MTPHDSQPYFDRIRPAVSAYLTWLAMPRVRTAPVSGILTHDKSPSPKTIKARILSGI